MWRPEHMTERDLAELAIDEIMRRLNEHTEYVTRVAEYYDALCRAAQLLDYATNRQVNPAYFQGALLKMLHDHQLWIERQRDRGLFPALSGTKRPVARHRMKKAK